LHWSIFPLEKWKILWESPKSFRLDSEVLTEEKTREKHGEKKGTENDLPYTYGYGKCIEQNYLMAFQA
jgi:hypothetical protein